MNSFVVINTRACSKEILIDGRARWNRRGPLADSFNLARQSKKTTSRPRVIKCLKISKLKLSKRMIKMYHEDFFFTWTTVPQLLKEKFQGKKGALKDAFAFSYVFLVFFLLFLFFFSFQINHPLRNKKCCYRWENYWNKLCLRVFLTEAACKNLNDPVIRTGSKLEKSCISFKIACGLPSAWFLLSKETCRRVFSLRPRERWEAFWYNKVRKKKVILKVNEFILAMNMRWSFK